ncbi:unnamed protein product [Sphagnum balticum]
MAERSFRDILETQMADDHEGGMSVETANVAATTTQPLWEPTPLGSPIYRFRGQRPRYPQSAPRPKRVVASAAVARFSAAARLGLLTLRLDKPTVTAADLRRAFYRLAREFHPDKNAGASAPAKYLAAQEAYDLVLKEFKAIAACGNESASESKSPLRDAS